MSRTIWLNTEEVEEEFNLKRSYIYKLTHQRRIPHYKLGNRLRFKKDELMSWLEAPKVDPVVVERR
jgi:excisionase family DNA binding protein